MLLLTGRELRIRLYSFQFHRLDDAPTFAALLLQTHPKKFRQKLLVPWIRKTSCMLLSVRH
jgi:hypothetical protein